MLSFKLNDMPLSGFVFFKKINAPNVTPLCIIIPYILESAAVEFKFVQE